MIRPINRCLNSQLLELCQRAMVLEELNDKIQANLNSPLKAHCQVAAFNRGCLVINAANAAWATELRYQLPELRDRLRKGGLYQLTSIKIAVADSDPTLILEPNASDVCQLSDKARSNIKMASELCSYPPLKEALCRLAGEE